MGINPFKSSLNSFRKAPLAQKTDDELMLEVARGSNLAFEVLFDRHGSLILGCAKKYLGSLERAEEASQDLWVKVVKQAPSYKGEGHFKAWAMTILKNHCLNLLRKDKRLSFHEEVEEHMETESLPDFEKRFFQRFNTQAVSQALDNLPEKQRVALTLLITEELSYEEIASEMDAGLGAVKSMIHRARKALQTELSGEVL